MSSRRWSQEEAIKFCRYLWGKLSRHGYFVGLTGSCLYQESGNDVDIIIYPHSRTVYSVKVVRQLLKNAGLRFVSMPNSIEYDTVNDEPHRVLEIWSYESNGVSKRVDVNMFIPITPEIMSANSLGGIKAVHALVGAGE